MNKILVLDDDKNMRDMISDYFNDTKIKIKTYSDPFEVLNQLNEENYDVILTDIKMPKMNGLNFCQKVKSIFPQIPIIVMTAFGSLDTAIKAIKVGAYDFVTKPVELETLEVTLQRALEHTEMIKQIKSLTYRLNETKGYTNIIGESDIMKEVFNLLKKIGSADIAIYITGETGTGKELIARALHKQSLDKLGPFISVNCAALPEHLLESELFGHVKGAYTGAVSNRNGLVFQANKGTLFLDEIADLPLDLQAKFLRVLEEKKIRHLGSDIQREVSFRLISASSKNIETLVEEKKFRQDLYYRLAAMTIELPALRLRGNDILLLAQKYLLLQAEHLNKDVRNIHSSTAKLLINYSWKGNVRELKNVIERAVVMATTKEIMPSDLPKKIIEYKSTQLPLLSDHPDDLLTLEDFEKKYINYVLNICGNNQTQTAKILGVDRKTLYRKLKS